MIELNGKASANGGSSLPKRMMIRQTRRRKKFLRMMMLLLMMMMRGKKQNQVNIVVGNETEMEQKKMVQNRTKRLLGFVHKG